MGRCSQWAFADEAACTHHAKMLAGLYEPAPHAFSRISPADVLSDEQMELVGVLEALMAAPAMIRGALTRAGSQMQASQRG